MAGQVARALWVLAQTVVTVGGLISWPIAGLLFFLMQEDLPRIEGTYSLVITSFTLDKVIDRGDGTTEISGYMIKNRDCAFISDSYIWIDDNGVSHAIRILKGTPTTRPLGANSWGPLVIDVPADILKKVRIVGKARHQCHPLWETETTLIDRFLKEGVEYGK